MKKNLYLSMLASFLCCIAGASPGQDLSSDKGILLTATFAETEPRQTKTLKAALTELEIKYKVSIMASQELIEDKTISSMPSDKSLEETLRNLLNGTKLKYEKISNNVYVISPLTQQEQGHIREIEPKQPTMSEKEKKALPLSAIENLSRQHLSTLQKRVITVSGKVTSETNESIPGVNVLLKGTSTGTTTNSDGNFAITVPDGKGTLVFSYIGYTTEEVPINDQTTINVQLNPDIKSLTEVVVVGYGTQEKKDLTGSVATIDSKSIADRQSLQLSDALQGTMAGVTVTRGGGQPGAGSTVRIRGVTSLNVNDPLVIVDGVPGLGINDVNPNDVESITVLKDAASQAIYGARAAAGVILVTTKRASEGKLQVSYDYEFGLNSPTMLPSFADAQTYRILANERSRNDGGGNIFNTTENENYAQLHANNPDLYPDTDWQKAVLSKNNTQRHRHDVALSVGSEKVKTRASLSYVSEDGLYANRNYERYTFRVNINLRLSKMLEASIDAYYKRTNTLDPNQDGVIALARRYPGIYSAIRTDGEWGEGKDGENPLAQTMEGGTLDQIFNQYSAVIGLAFTPLEGLSIRVNFSPTYNYNLYDRFSTPALIPRLGSNSQFWPQNPTTLEKRQTSFINLTRQATINYTKKLGEHSIGALAGYEEISSDYEEVRTTSRELSVNLRSLTFGDPALANNSQFASQNALRSYFGRVSYDYKGKYLIQSNLRADASSRFAPDKRWGLFPSVSLGWVATNENFNLPGFISFLKLRASYGEVGNERIGEERTGGSEFFNYYPYQNLFERANVVFYNNGNFISNLGIRQDFLADRLIVWETTKTVDAGLDIHLFNNQLTFAADYYHKNTQDIILTLDLPNYLGYANDTKTNVGSMKVKGLDLEAGYRNMIGQFRYSVNVNASTVGSEVTNVGGRKDFTTEGGTKINIVGSEFNEWFGYQTNGIFQTKEEADAYGTNAAAGDIWIVDQLTIDTDGDGLADAGDKIINEEDRLPLGASLPKFTYGGNVSMSFKGFDLSLVFNGVGKHTRRYAGFQVRPFDETFGNISANLLGSYWSTDNTPEQNLSANYPRFSGRSERNNYAVSDYWLFNGSYFRMKNITLGYSLPQSLVERVKLSQVRFYASLRDYITLEKNFLTGWDPEVDDSGYPIMKSVLFGVNLKF
ncbi:SusC/RagA family TonB-linked outer membrane protein [Rhodocytophaga aerolata]|uniref:SusC/RagA family TonB-linked outer membrane protein n=1 Tax=Rhodocytophaga aerolata TaxID=455078 RepID=A0ABT8RE91_9BACT|nr:SusC/RagA family TonB-linked outer membrane protein [Rhodocytophaga aerolata]MDO1449664.1 SusC/RagA family TonB-linked outer membrane protein [Rhodocytophaga aerolata]